MPPKFNRSHKGARRARRQAGSKPPPPLALRPIPNMRINCVFKQEVAITETAPGLGASKWYRVGGAFDPDQSAGGPSALGFNQYASLFTSYRVHAVRVQVVGTLGNATGGASFAVCTLTPNPRTQTLPADPALWGGEPGSISKMVTPQPTGGQNSVVLDKTFYPWKILRITKAQYMTESDYASLVTTTPVKEAFIAVTVNGVLTSSVVTLACMVTVSYEIEFFEPNLLV